MQQLQRAYGGDQFRLLLNLMQHSFYRFKQEMMTQEIEAVNPQDSPDDLFELCEIFMQEVSDIQSKIK